MIEVEHELGRSLYDEIRKIILEHKNDENCSYQKKQHNLYENVGWEIKKNFYNEEGHAQFKNKNGDLVEIEISRWHSHQHNGYSGLCGSPCLNAVIYLNKDERQKVWELKINCRTLHYDGCVSSLEIPRDILKKESIVEEKVEEVTDFIKKAPLEKKESLFSLIREKQGKVAESLEMRKSIFQKRDRKIAQMKEEIMNSYSTILTNNEQEITLFKTELNEFKILLHQYSTFHSDIIGEIIRELISIYEGEKYTYQMVQYTSRKIVHGVMDSWEKDVNTRIKLIGSDFIFETLLNSRNLNDDSINGLINTNEILLLSKEFDYIKGNSDLSFYSLDDSKINCHVHFGRFDYVKDFIDELIQYRFQHDLDDISKEDIILVLQDYLKRHQENVIMLHDKKIKQKISGVIASIS